MSSLTLEASHYFISKSRGKGLDEAKNFIKLYKPIDIALNDVKEDNRNIEEIRKIIKIQKPDVVNTHTSKAVVLARLATKSVNRKTPVVHTFHGHLIYGYFARYKSIVFSLIEKIMSRFTNVAVAVTSETKNSLTKLGIGRNLPWRVIQIGIPARVATQTGAAEQTFKLLWIGRFTQIKDPSLAVKIIKNFASQMKHTMNTNC
jgi:glycosyltransferase involved in cell wall biosynthesis